MEELYYALAHVNIQRVHTTLEINDFDFITENVKYTFYNNGNKTVSILLLPAREKKIQRTMVVTDSSNRNLVLIPSTSAAALFAQACSHILERACQHLDASQKPLLQEVIESVRPHLEDVFKYESPLHKVQQVCDVLDTVVKIKPPSKEYIREIFPFIELLSEYREGLYHPLVALLEPLNLKAYSLIHLSMERLHVYLQNRWERIRIFTRFGILGRFTFSFAPEIHPHISNHMRIYAPEGLLIKNVEFDLSNQSDSQDTFCKKLEEDLNSQKKNFFDERLFYVQIGPEESSRMYKCSTHFNVTFGLNSFLSLFSLLWWLLIFSPTMLKVLQQLPFSCAEVMRSSDVVLTILGLSVTVLALIGGYSFSKKIIWHFITRQVILAYLIFVLEILLINMV